MSTQPPPSARQARIAATVQGIVGRVLRIPPQEIDVEAPFLELGADSLALVEALRGLQEAFGVRLTIRQLFEQLPSIAVLAAFLDQTLPAEAAAPAVAPAAPAATIPPPAAPPPTIETGASCPLPAPTPLPVQVPAPAPAPAPAIPPPLPALATAGAPAVGASALERVFGLQIQAFNQLVAQQLQTLGARPAGGVVPAPAPRPAVAASSPALPAPPAPAPAPAQSAPPAAASPAAARPVLPTFLGKAGGRPGAVLSERQRQHLDELTARYCAKTAKSKELTERFRPWLADSRATVGFRATSKEMLYPLARARARGSRVWDVDGNEYVDVTMGMGVHLFGHHPDWLQEAIERQVREGFELGPRSAHSGEAAALFCELTGLERATFTNSGTEACMTAIRLARARTGRTRIAMFAGSYHGHSDGTLAQTQEVDGELRSFPVAPGIPPGVAADVLVLDYGTDHALEVIRRHRGELAAVFVEPIQSRRPDLQPRAFLHELRRITAESGIALVFDEMITGFRLHLGGAQAWFGVRADLATYGKVIGGGLPIGVVAGAAEYMDGIDGGAWRYGDGSRPERDTTFFGGTFCQHPLAMSAAREVLSHLKRQGPALQEDLNARTTRFAGRLGEVLAAEGAPIRVVHAHSLFRFAFGADADLFFYHLVDKGVYVWEWRNCFLSTAHTDADLDLVADAVAESVRELRRGGFLPDRPAGPKGPGGPAGTADGGEGRQEAPAPPASPAPAAPAPSGTWERRGVKPALAPARPQTGSASAGPRHDPDLGRDVRFGLYFFGNYGAEFQAGKYDLLLDSARFADRHGFTALWLPERHFHPFGGLSPNPSVLAAALARETARIALRAGSVVLPLHHPVRVAEEWALVDNLSGGRVGLSYASGWHPNDFALAPEAWGRHRDLMIERAETVGRLWRGEAVRLCDGAGKEVDLRIFPLPARRDLPVWITVVNNPETYRLAGEMGAGVLTNLMGQTPEALAANLAVYRRALADAGHPPAAGRVTLLLHTFLGPDAAQAVAAARAPFHRYLESSVGLVKNALASEGQAIDFDRLSREDLEYMLELAYRRYVQTSALIGSPESVAPIVERLHDAGVDEIACLVDFGPEPEAVRASLPWVAALRTRFRSTKLSARFRPRPHRGPAAAPATESDRVPLTEAQRDLYAAAQLGEEASLAYLEPGVLEIRGPLDAGLLERALQAVVDRHEALRAVVPPPADPENPVQEILPEVRVELPLIDAAGCPADRREAVSSAWLEAESRRPFDLARGPLLRAGLLRLAPRLHRLGVFVHHIAADGLSLAVLLRDLLAVYEAERAGCRPVLPPPFQLREYVAWLAAGGAGYPGEEAGDEAWWLARFAAPLPVFEPPTDRPRPAVRTFRGARRRTVLAPGIRRALQQAGRRQGATLFISLLAAWTAVLHRWTGQDDLVVGGPAARRPLEGGDRLVGHSVDLVPYRSRLADHAQDTGQPAGEPTFLEHLAALRGLVLDAQEHGGYPLGRLLRALRLPHDPGRVPLINAVFNFDPGMEIARAAGLELVEHPPAITHVKFDVALHVVEIAGDLVLQLDYRSDLFDGATLERHLEHLAALAAGAAEDPLRPLGDLPLMTAAERRQVVDEWNDTAAAYPDDVPVHRLFAAVARRDPGAPAVLWAGPDGDECLTYGELAERAGRLARRLRGLGVGPEATVVLEMERSPELVVAMLGVLAAGGAYLPIDPADPEARRTLLREDAGAVVQLATGDVTALLAGGEAGEIGEIGARDGLDAGVDAGCLAYVIYTSGSTGRPKGVAVTHRAIARLVLDTDYVRLGPGDRVAHLSNTAFDAATFEVWGALLNGAAVAVIPPAAVLSPQALGAELRRWRICAAFMTTALFQEMVRAGLAEGGQPAASPLAALAGVGQLITGGEVMAPARAAAALAHGVRFQNAYGPTECTTFALMHPLAAVGEGSIPIGRPIANTRAWVLDALLRPVAIGTPGELCLGGDGLARGYHRRPELTAERFVPSPFEPGGRLYRTGDRVRRLADGSLEFLGRIDAQVKVRGFRIEPGEIEAVLAGCPGVREGAVVVRATAGGERRLAAFVVAGAGESPDPRAYLRARLPAYMVPAELEVLAAFPRTPAGKVDRLALAARPPAERSAAEPPAGQAPATPLQEIVAGVWSEVLERGRIGVHESFFDLGGHSLLAGRVLSRLRALLGVELSLRDFFRAPTVAGLARQAEAAQPAGPASPPLLPRLPNTAPAARRVLSFAQERLWFIDQLTPDLPLYAIPALYRIAGPLREDVLAAALGELVRRHEALRTVFVAAGDGTPAQQVLPPGPVPLCRIDLLALPAALRQAEAERQILAEARRPFDLAVGPVLRGTLVRCGREQHVLLLNMHHIAADGWSIGVVAREVSAHYTAFAAGRTSALPPPPVQYADYAEWQRGWLQGQVLEDQLAYWRQQLSGAPGALDLPADRPRPAVPTYAGESEGLRIDEALAAGLGRLGRQQGATLFMTLLAAFDALLHRSTGAEDVVVGSPVANRTRAEVEDLVGFFVNTLVLRADLAGDPTFIELMERVREVALGAYVHQDLPFEKLVEDLAPERDLSHSPLFQVVFALYGSRLPALDLGPGLSAAPGEAATGTSKYFLSLLLEGTEGDLAGAVEYSSDLFDPATIGRLIGHYRTLLAGIVARPDGRLSELPLLTSSERTQVLEEWSSTAPARDDGATVHGLVLQQAELTPDRVALVGPDGGQMTYGQLALRAGRLARHLRARGVGPEVRVAVCLERSAELVTAFLGVLGAGGAYVPLDPAYPRERLELMLADSEASVLLVERGTADLFSPAATAGLARLVLGWAPLPAGLVLDRLDSAVDAAGLAYVIYTSGSTGRPKGVAVPHRGVVRLVRGMEYARRSVPESFLQLNSVCFDASVLEMWGCLANGGRLVVAPAAVTIEAVAGLVERYDVSVLCLTPGTFEQAVQEHLGRLRPLSQLVCGGDVMPPGAVRRCLEELPGVRLLNGYGPTENTVFTSTYELTAADGIGAAVPIGYPIPGTRTYVLDRRLEPVPCGVAGELLAGGAGLARGYHGRPELTAERFVPDPFGGAGERLYRTGDLVRHRPDGSLDFLGRRDRQVKVRGFRIELAEVEVALAAHPGVRQAVAAVLRRGPADERLAAWIVPSDEARPRVAELRSWLGERLPAYMVPTTFTLLAAFPLSATGKVDRDALARLEAAPETGYQTPRTPLEAIVAGIWEEVLEVDAVGLEDNFFDLGGHSLLAGVVLFRLRAALGVELALRSFFQQPTVAGLAHLAEQARHLAQGLPAPPLQRVPRSGPLPLSFAQERLWLVEQLQPGSAAYNSYLPTCFGGRLDAAALEGALAEIQRRHEVLRARFERTPEGPVQVFAPAAVAWRLPLIDLAGLPAPLRRGELERLAGEEGRRPFDLARGPLLRAALLRAAEREHVLLLCLHHTVCDAWSLQVMTRELAALYGAAVTGAAARLPELPVQYADYAVWQRGWLQGEVLAAELAWWRRQLGEDPPVLALPADRPRPPAQSFRGAALGFRLAPAAAAALTALGRRQGGTLFTTLLAAYLAVLHRHTNQPRISVGTPVAGRNRAETEGLIGFFVNTLVLCGDLGGDPAVGELLGRVRDTTLDAFDHQDLPFEKLVAALQTGRDLNRQALFQAMFALQNIGRNDVSLPGLDLSPLPLSGAGVTPFDLVLTAAEPGDEDGGGLRVALSYAADLFDRTTAARLLGHLERALAELPGDLDRPLSALPLLAAAERHQVTVEWAAAPGEPRVRVLDGRLRPVAIGVWGDLYLGGPAVAPPAAGTADERLVRAPEDADPEDSGSGWLLATGERARFLADGRLVRAPADPAQRTATPDSASPTAEEQGRIAARRDQLSARRRAVLDKLLGVPAGPALPEG